MAKSDLTAQRLRELLHYDPETGIFTRLFNTTRTKAGGVAGGSGDDGNGYQRISVDGFRYRAHRLAWLYVYGNWPTEQIDHRNGDRGDNRIVNLRDATLSINAQNRRALGATWNGKRWIAQIMINRIGTYLGSFDTLEEARSAYLSAKRVFHEGCTI